MSKIIPISENPAIYPQGNVQRTSTDVFKQSLEKAMEARETSGVPNGPKALGEIRAAAFYPINSSAENVAIQTNQLLDLLDDYARNLNNPSKSLRDMAPLMDEISINVQELLHETEKMPPNEEKLREIASSAATTAQVELIKFKRGDYV
jgi:hypothetical protein